MSKGPIGAAQPPSARSRLFAEAVRFGGAGVLNTLITLVTYQLLLSVLAPSTAYAATWLLGLTLVATLYPAHVFERRGVTARTRLGMAAVYGASFALGLLVVTVVSELPGGARIAIFIALVVTSLFNFFVLRWVVRNE